LRGSFPARLASIWVPESHQRSVRKPSIWSKAWRAFRSGSGATWGTVAVNGRLFFGVEPMSAFTDRAIRFVFALALSTLAFTICPALTASEGILSEAVREFADIHKAILMDADVDECAELGDIGDDAFEDHFWLNIGEFADFSLKLGATNCSRGSRPGLRSSSKLSLTVNAPASIWQASTLFRS
jgi:hypothetical protein